MLEKILEYERGLFLWLNGCHNSFWDGFMWLYTGQAVWIPVTIFLFFILFYQKNWKESLLILLSIALIIALCDQLSSHICKPYFMRFRPTHHPDFMEYVKTVNDYRGGKYGFISGHACNAFGFATFLLLFLRRRLITVSMLIWSTLMAYSRIYLGVHFISDIIPGALAGCIIGFLCYKLYVTVRRKLLKKNNKPCEMYTDAQINYLLPALLSTVLFIVVYSWIKIS
ncbi:MAG: phosphatase PAP2 family protein [Tannerella sp.]|jgi:undecaprenyl-diphosphatase|nr:phosphatase PAP2 family protein [Tannerella sp.]